MVTVQDSLKLTFVLFLFLLAPGVHADPADEPLPPWGLVADSTQAGVELSWNAPADGDVDGYHVYRADSLDDVLSDGLDAFTVIGETTSTSFLDTGVFTESSSGGNIYFVTALRGGEESRPSNPAGMYPNCIAVDFGCFWPPPLIP